jgi:hypothetical protein
MTIGRTLCDRVKLAFAERRAPPRGTEALAGTLRDCAEIVYLSPHYDDICFSLGGLARTLGRGRLVNLFTRDAWAPRHGIRRATDAPTVAHAVALRDAEDARFAEACGLERHDLGLDSAALRGRGSRDLAGVTDDRGMLAAPLDALLARIARDAPAGRPLALFVPAGVGGHVNHVATMAHVAAARPALEPRWRLHFYEDLPYGAVHAVRRKGLLRLFAHISVAWPVRHVVPLDAEAKVALINLYASQFVEDIADLGRFTPAFRRHGAAHEAVWTFPERS